MYIFIIYIFSLFFILIRIGKLENCFKMIYIHFLFKFIFMTLVLQIPEHTLPLLVTLIEGQIKELRVIIEHIHSSGSCSWSESVQKKIDGIHEDIHWMFLIAGMELNESK